MNPGIMNLDARAIRNLAEHDPEAVWAESDRAYVRGMSREDAFPQSALPGEDRSPLPEKTAHQNEEQHVAEKMFTGSTKVHHGLANWNRTVWVLLGRFWQLRTSWIAACRLSTTGLEDKLWRD